MANTTVNTPISSTTKGTIPAAVQITGTITSTGVNVVGVGTLFTTELQKGDYIYNTTAATNVAVRKVTAILDDTHLKLESTFPANVAAINLFRVRGAFSAVGIANTGAAAGVLNEGPIAIGASPSYEAKPGFSVDPVSFDATGTTFNIFTSK